MSLFEDKNIQPMLIGKSSEAFDDPDYIYELKLDGERCVAYLDESGTELRNKRNQKMLLKVPELVTIHKQVRRRCILDGELIIVKDGKPDFFLIQKRSLMSNSFKIQLASQQYPASFTAFDILYDTDRCTTDLPLILRKERLQSIIHENERLAISRYIVESGIQFYQLAEQNQLEGIVAKKKESKYYFGKRTTDWIKIKSLQDDDFIICGYILKENHVISLVLGQYDGLDMQYMGHITLGVSTTDFKVIQQVPVVDIPSFIPDKGNENAVWINPVLVCTVKFMMRTKTGSMRQPVFKGLRYDKTPTECKLSP